MKYAIIDGKKSEAKPKSIGVCPNCNSVMVAKCGKHKIWHWAHKSKQHCDPWWENETEWHRNWKNNFPVEWQEISHTDPQSGEQHIADIKNPYGLVLEFQHSNIKSTERISREKFYKNMVWVIDGTRNSLDLGYFNLGLSGPIQKSPLAYQITWWGKSKLLQNWSESEAKVFIDFGSEVLWRLILFKTEQKIGAVSPLHKTAFIEDCLNGTNISVSELD